MIPVVVSPPTSAPRRRAPGRWLSRAVGVVLVAAGILGALVWVVGFSPLGFDRFGLGTGPQTIRLETRGEYILYEERSGDAFPSFAAIAVTGPDGEPVALRPPAGVTDGAVARSLPLYNAWEVGRFSVRDPGDYGFASGRADAGQAPSSSTFAVASARTTTWVGGWAGLVALAVMPLALGVGVLWASWGSAASREGAGRDVA